MAFALGFGLILAAFLLYLHRRDRLARREHPLTARYRQLCANYADLGWPRQLPETPLRFAERIAAARAPESQHFVEISRRYAAWRYRTEAATPPVVRDLLGHMRGLHWRLRLRQRPARQRASRE